MIFNRRLFIVIFTVVCFCKMLPQSFKMQKGAILEDAGNLKIKWNAPLAFQQKGKLVKTLSFDGVSFIEEKEFLPYLLLKEVCKQGVKMQAIIQPVLTETLSAQEEASINKTFLTDNFDIIEAAAGTSKKTIYMFCKLIPLRINKTNGKIEKLVSYRLQWHVTNDLLQSVNERNGNQHNKTQAFANSSVLNTGTWYKIGTAENAVYKIDKAFLQHMGIDVSSIDPRNIKIYGNGGEMLSEVNSAFHYDDLTENAIFVNDGSTVGVFDNNDYVLFYGQSPHKWKYNAGKNAVTRYTRNKHYYSDSVFYFLNVDIPTSGKRITTQTDAAAPVTNVVNSFDDYQFHENDATNLVTSGRELYGENFDNTQTFPFNFYFPNLQNDTVWLKTDILGRRVQPLGNGSFDISYPGAGSYSITFSSVCSDYECDVGAPINGTGTKYFIYNGAPNNPINISVNRTYTDETGWLNYIWVIARRALTMQGNQMSFRDYRSIGANAVSQFNVQSTSSTLRIWNVTDQLNISEQQATFATNNYSFSIVTDTLKQFIAFDGTSYKIPAFVGHVTNQNLHAYRNYNYIIVAPQGFHSQAEQLITLHANPHNENLTGIVVTPDEIYNEFSSGVQDITAIRQFVRMLYQQSTILAPQYLLLYGTGSYLQKNRYDASNTVMVPAFETYNSWSRTNSKTGDDFYAFLDDNEGVIDMNGNASYFVSNTTYNNLMDIGVGRLPVKNSSEATAVANKIAQYYNRVEPTSSCCDQATQNTPDWRNWVCLIADDANPNTNWEYGFVDQQEGNASLILQNQRYNIDKIYEDAYQVETVPGGRRYPDVVTAINNRVAKGALIIGYSGHGGELGLAHEEVITINQIQEWNNINNMPLFFTATCEFSRYDDPSIESAGEDIILNPNGGGIGLFTTTRLAYITDGTALGPVLYPVALDSFINGKRPTLGDIMRLTKISRPNYLHFALLGDPAVTLSYPKQYTSNLITVNTHTFVQGGPNDTLSALGKYIITGSVSDVVGNKLSWFNGNIYISVFDKPSIITTLNNSQNTSPSTSNYLIPFKQQKSVLYKGKSAVVNGDFTYTFIVPKDILYSFGNGKISYYAQTDTSDAAGYFSQIIIGGTSNTPVIDHQGPGIKLFMNDEKFVTGGNTNQNPFIYALLSDSSGVNTTGNSLGHDIVAILDANTPHEVVLNDYYQADLNKYQSGKILYQLHSLSNGHHTLSMKVWDVMDNSSTSSTDFVVAENAQMALSHVLNYPNPFTTSTKFYVEHNQACDVLNVEVQIFTITGKIVKTILQTVENQGFRTDGIGWDGKDDYGDKLARGVYIYKVTVKNSEGSKADKIEKLVILN
jgi:hypothetical protein